MINPIKSQTGSFYDKDMDDLQEGTDNTFDQTNDLAGANLGNCSATYCHGTDSFQWATPALTASDNCTICHGLEQSGTADMAAPTEFRAPGVNDLGVDTEGQVGIITGDVSSDPEVGAHNVHMLLPYAYTDTLNPIGGDNCNECHLVPATIDDADHWDTNGLPAEVFTTNTPEKADINGAPSYNPGTGQCSNVYCHGANMNVTTTTGNNSSPTWFNVNFLTGTTTLAGDCDECHEAPPSDISDHTGLTVVSECNACHTHFNTSGGFDNDTDRARHIDGNTDVDAECVTCHATAKTDVYMPRQITGAGGDFVKLSRHVNNGTSTEIVTSYDCAVCHAEGDVTKINLATGWTSDSLHNDGSDTTDRFVNLRNVDNYAGATYDFSKYQLDETMRDDLDSFCLGCHDFDGASDITVNSTDDGLDTGGSVTRNLTPFNTNDNLANGRDIGDISAGTRTRVIDVDSQYDTANPSHHAVKGQRYTTQHSATNPGQWDTNTWTTNHTLRSGDDITSVKETATLHCSDCHLSETSAHGAANAWYMLLNGTADDFTTDQVMTDQDPQVQPESLICYKCHNSSVYTSIGTVTGAARADHNLDVRWDDDGKAEFGTGSDRAYLGPACLLCHSGDGFGHIHGRGSATDGDDGTYQDIDPPDFPGTSNWTGTNSYSKYRFMPGAWNRWSPRAGGPTADPDDGAWNITSSGDMCYFAASTATTWAACTSHAGSGSAGSPSTNYARPTNY
jgi:predicted CxxxxCH...CXXCH cytochrome family protein